MPWEAKAFTAGIFGLALAGLVETFGFDNKREGKIQII